MSEFYDDARATATEMLTEFGQTMTLKKLGDGEWNDETQTIEPVETASTVTGAAFAYPARAIDGTVIQQGDQRVYLSAQWLAMPDVNDVLTFDGADHRIISVKPLAPAGLANLVMVELQVRSA